jgi:hypothetical protein
LPWRLKALPVNLIGSRYESPLRIEMATSAESNAVLVADGSRRMLTSRR